ncbi:MAG: efflux RND transporter periplasmic adaptor subunit [Candidatus Hydrogenedentes bacterium]|nr:efflux RND transporter periplasmic adaptor subunit [Candidatus Hydrogenedentota bacterium]
MKRRIYRHGFGLWIIALISVFSCTSGEPSARSDARGHPHDEPEHAHADAPAHPQESADDHAEEGNAHEHGEQKTAQVTVWTDRFELFVEHALAVAKTPVRFITHVTDLVTLHPRREGPVTFVMQGPSGEQREHVEENPARAGIYLPELTFLEPGAWKISLRIPLDDQEFIVDLPPTPVYATEHEAAHAPEPAAPEGITFLKEQQWKILSKTDSVRRRPLSEELRLAGVIRPLPGKRALVTPPVEGHLTRPADGPLPFIGDSVVEGQLVALLQPVAASALQALALELDVKSAETEASIREAQAALEKANQSLDRTRGLYEKKAKSVKEVEEAEFAQRQAAAALDAARALKRSYHAATSELRTKPASSPPHDGAPVLPIRAPINGRVVSVDASEGEFVRPDKSLFTILDVSVVLIEARVPESDLARIRPDLGATYALPGAPNGLKPIVDGNKGRFVLLGSEIDSATRTAPLIYEVPNPDGLLRIGLALTVFVETSKAEEALVVPLSAIVEEEGRAIAYVQLAGEAFERRDLTLGIRTGNFAQVLSGLNEGERVVTEGAYAVRLASVSSVIPAHGHAH